MRHPIRSTASVRLKRSLKAVATSLIFITQASFVQAENKASVSSDPKAAGNEWIINLPLAEISHDTGTQITSIKGIKRVGLLSLRKGKDKTLTVYWERGAYRPTFDLNGAALSKGNDLNDPHNLLNARLSPSDSLLILRAKKNGNRRVELVQDGESLAHWDSTMRIGLWDFDDDGLLFAKHDIASGEVEILRAAADDTGKIRMGSARSLGRVKDCALTGGTPIEGAILLQGNCTDSPAAGLWLLEPDSTIRKISRPDVNSFLNNGLFIAVGEKRKKGEFGMLEVSGTADALHAYYAIDASVLANLGEPASVASDEAGRQSWVQGYRTSALATLFEKTGHQSFAALARNAMGNTLAANNGGLGIAEARQPSCGWASRVYSTSGKTPLTLLVNQGMILGGLIRSCDALGTSCPENVRRQIADRAICLVGHFEKDFDPKTGLYRIPRGIDFRNDGLWAPWNWQTNWAVVLNHAAAVSRNREWKARAEKLVKRFASEMQHNEEGALWRYWPEPYYQGWTISDGISTNRPDFIPKPKERYEDVNHGGISLLAACELGLEQAAKKGAKMRLENLLDQGLQVARDFDGRGLRSALNFPSIGWDCLDSEAFRAQYTNALPAARGAPKQLTYARLFRPHMPFELNLQFYRCTRQQCQIEKTWNFRSLTDYLNNSPFFNFEASH